MLTLTRKPGESIHIGDEIEVVVKEIRGGAVRLGIQAPSEVFIYRGELYRKIHRENLRAARTRPDDVMRAAQVLLGEGEP
jgi:carbon storage regulator